MRRPTSAIVATICLLAVWIATPLVSVAHVVLVEHRFCAEHERLEEGDERHASGNEEGDSSDRGAKVSPSNPEESLVGHEGCAFGENFTLEDHFVLILKLVGEPVLVTDASPVLRTTSVAESVPLLLVAPKSSPPQIA